MEYIFYDYCPPSTQSGARLEEQLMLSVTSESMCTEYWLTC